MVGDVKVLKVWQREWTVWTGAGVECVDFYQIAERRRKAEKAK